MYLPKSKYTVKQATWGMFTLSGSTDGRSYVGPYIEDYLGRTYAGSTLDGAENRVLIPREDDVESPEPVQTKVDILPTEKDYLSGSMVRYFRQNRSTRAVEEVDREKAQKSKNWKVISGSWVLTGSLDDQKIYGHTYRGVRTRNQKTLDSWEEEIPGITEALNLKAEDLYQKS